MNTINYTQDYQVAKLTFNRPEKMNAFNMQMAKQLEEIISKIKADPNIRVVVLRGAGEVFMAGNDLLEFYEEFETFSAEALSIIRYFNSTILALREMEKPVVSIVHGLVTGTGMSLMLASDLVIASKATQFSLGFNRVATTPAGGVSFILPRLVGSKKALELLLMSETFDAETAYSYGLINWVIPPEELNEKVSSTINYLVNGPSLAFAQTKQLINSSWQNKVTTQLELEAESFLRSVNSRDFKTAVRAFVNKREPEFEGR